MMGEHGDVCAACCATFVSNRVTPNHIQCPATHCHLAASQPEMSQHHASCGKGILLQQCLGHVLAHGGSAGQTATDKQYDHTVTIRAQPSRPDKLGPVPYYNRHAPSLAVVEAHAGQCPADSRLRPPPLRSSTPRHQTPCYAPHSQRRMACGVRKQLCTHPQS